jgi:hypothetical protein
LRVFVVTYQVRLFHDPRQVVEVLQKLGHWCHYFDKTWLIQTNATADEIYNQLTPLFNEDERLLILEVRPPAMYQGWLPQEAWDWIRQRLGSPISWPLRPY